MLKIAQIGMGHDHASGILKEIKKQNDVFEIAGIYLPEEEKEFAYFYDKNMEEAEGIKRLSLDEILRDPTITAVIIETSEKMLTKYALLAAKAGKHIHMDKPGGMNLSEFESLVDVVRKNGTVFHLGYMYRYNPGVTKLIQEIKDGELGEIISVEAQMSQIYDFTPKKRQWLEQFEGGMMFFLGCHLVDLVVAIKGVPDKVVPFNKSTGLEGVTAKDFGMAILEYKNGASFVRTCAREVHGASRRQLVVHGSKKTVEINPIEMIPVDDKFSAKIKYYQDEECEIITEPLARYESMLKSFAEMAEGIKKNPITYDYELDVYKTILKACGENNL